jgi:hypothetical protein
MELSGIIQKPITGHNNSTSESYAGSKMSVLQASIAKKSDSIKEPVQIAQVEQIDLKRADEKRLNNIKKTVEREMTSNIFAVSDNRFTIFKDAKTGQFITRFTSLRDGAVTYVPEPNILKLSGANEAYFEVQA